MADEGSLTRSDRVDIIYAMMDRGEWIRGVSGPPLAKQWGVDERTVRAYAAEAWNILKRSVANPEEVQTDVSTILRRDIERASAEGRYSDTAKLGDVLTRILGARAAEKHEVTMTEDKARETWERLTGKPWTGDEK